MSTKNQQQAQFNPQGMAAYNSMQGGFANTVNDYINNPFNNPFFQTQSQMGYRTAQQQNQTNMSNITRNLNLSGISSSPAGLEMMNNQMRAGTANSANLGFLSPVSNAQQMQTNALGFASSYRPLQTGQTQTQSGLGSWLPQVLGGAMGLAGGIMSGGATAALGSGVMKGTMGAMSSALSPMQSPFFSPGGNMPVNGSYGLGMNAPDVGGYNFGSSPFAMGQPSY